MVLLLIFALLLFALFALATTATNSKLGDYDMRDFTWVSDSADHSDCDTARATALAAKWNKVQAAENSRLNRYQNHLADDDSAYDYEDCECDACLDAEESGCKDCECRKADTDRELAALAEYELDIELIEEKLTLIGARMMRPYEHWNEDEQFMAYQERDREEY